MITVRDPQVSDEDEWRRLWSGYNAFYEAQIPEAVTSATWRRMLDPTSAVVGRLAVLETAIVGFTVSVVHACTWTVDPICYLEDLFVEPNHRRPSSQDDSVCSSRVVRSGVAIAGLHVGVGVLPEQEPEEAARREGEEIGELAHAGEARAPEHLLGRPPLVG